MSDPSAIALQLRVGGPEDSDQVELNRVSQRFREELAGLDVETLTSVAGSELPVGAKATGALEIGQLSLVILPVILPKLIDFIQAWCLRNSDRTITIKTPSMEIQFPPGGLPSKDLAALLAQSTPRLTQRQAARKH